MSSTENRSDTTFNEYYNVGRTTQTHNDNGNLTSGTQHQYVWDAKNRLVEVTDQSDVTIASYLYDTGNRRVRKEIGTGATAGSDTDYYYSGWQVLEERPHDSAMVTYSYVWGNYLDEAIARDDSSDRIFYLQNTLYSVYSLANDSGTIVEEYFYDPYGKQAVSDGTESYDNVIAYTGQRLDFETGLNYYKNRYYDSIKGRFISRDPIGYVDGPSLYAYALLNPLYFFDSMGLAVETGWDVFNIGVGVVSFASNCATGNAIGALVDAGGLVYDVTATAVPIVPGGASTAIKTYRLTRSSAALVKNMLSKAKSLNGKGGDIARQAHRYILTQFDQAHHIIPKRGPSKKWRGGTLRKQMDELRDRAKSAGIDLDTIVNGVSLPKGYHLTETLGESYYVMILNRFKSAKTSDDFTKILDELAEDLMRGSGKLK